MNCFKRNHSVVVDEKADEIVTSKTFCGQQATRNVFDVGFLIYYSMEGPQNNTSKIVCGNQRPLNRFTESALLEFPMSQDPQNCLYIIILITLG